MSLVNTTSHEAPPTNPERHATLDHVLIVLSLHNKFSGDEKKKDSEDEAGSNNTEDLNINE